MCRDGCGLLSREAMFPLSATARRGPGWPSSPCQSVRIVLPRQPPAARRRAAGVRRKRSRPRRPGASRAAAPGAKPRSGADRRELSLAQAQIRGAEPSASPARARHASTAQRRTPPRRHLRRGRGILPGRARAASPRPSHTARRRSTWQHGSRTSHAAPHGPGGRPVQARNNSGQYPLSPAGAKPLLSRADLLPDCYQEALPGTPNYPYLYSNYCCELGGAMGIRTPDLLHAMQRQHVHRSVSVQVTVSGRPHESSGIQAGCCTFVLCTPSGASTGTS